MKSKKISLLEVIRIWRLVHELLPAYLVNKTKRCFDVHLDHIINEASTIPEIELLHYDFGGNSTRFNNYHSSVWELGEISLAECGVWPCMGGLPDNATNGSLMETTEYVRHALKKRHEQIKVEKTVQYIERLTGYVEKITNRIPIMVFTDGLIRQSEYGFTKKGQRDYAKCAFDIDDGNHRAIALSLLGKKKIKAFIGRINTNSKTRQT